MSSGRDRVLSAVTRELANAADLVQADGSQATLNYLIARYTYPSFYRQYEIVFT